MSKLIKTSDDLTTLKKVEEGKYEIDYGTIKKGIKVEIEVELSTETEMTKFFAKPSCGGCTKVKTLYVKSDKAGVYVNYDTNLLGRINKSVYFFYEDKDNKDFKTTIKLIGKIEP